MSTSMEMIAAKTITEVPRALAAGVVDMATGRLLAVETAQGHPQHGLESAATATAELFEGQDVRTIEQTWQGMRGAAARERYFEEIVVVSSQRIRIFARLAREEPTALVVVCRIDVDLGLALVKTRAVATREGA